MHHTKIAKMSFEIKALGNKESEVMLYGTVDSWGRVSAEDIDYTLKELRARGFTKATFRVHSPGGSVNEGFAILGVMANYDDIEKVFIIEGIAASMMTIIMLGADSITALPTARIMIHQPSARVEGKSAALKKTIAQLDQITAMMASEYSKKTGKTIEWVNENLMPSDGDVWLTATEAKEIGLIDSVKISSKSAKPIEAYAGLDTAQIIAKYDDIFNLKPNPKIKMDNNQINAILAIFGAVAITGSLQQEEAFEILRQKATGIKAKADAQTEELKTLREDAQKKDLEALKAEMQVKGIATKQQEKYLALADKVGLDVVKSLLEDIPSIADVKVITPSKEGEATGSDDWSFDEWSEKDPKTLQAMATENPARFDKLIGENLKSKAHKK